MPGAAPTHRIRRRTCPAISVEGTDLRLIRIFLRVVDAGGMSAAQASLNLSLSSISEKIAALEARFGLKLCRRGRGGFALTKAGEEFYEECQRLIATLDQFSARVNGLSSALPRSITIGLVDNMISDPLCPVAEALAHFVEVAPNTHIEITTLSPGELLREVIAQKADLVIGSFPYLSLGLDYIDLHEETHNLYCGAGHPLFAVPDDQIGIDTVRQHRIIARGYWASRDIRIFAISAPHATVSNMEAEAHLILSGAYIGYLPDHFARLFGAALRPMRADLFSYRARFQIATRQDWTSRPATRALIDLLQDVAASRAK
jgi:DNA-binding transcriptional LysR family regulator